MGLIPVLPGETMTNCFFQAQFWTDPLKAFMKSTPWTFEFFLFYCKFRDLPGWEQSVDGIGKDLIDMIEIGEDIKTPYGQAARHEEYFTAKGGIQYTSFCLQRITECYFREDGQAWNAAQGPSPESYPLAHVHANQGRDVLEKFTVGAVGVNPVPEDRRVAMPAYVGGLVQQAWQDYAANRNQTTAELMAMDYEDIVRSAGGKAVVRNVDREDLHVPELLGMVRHWDYPTNTVEPTTGAPSVAFGHRVKQALKQNFRFPEFGWIVPIGLWRPKAFWGNQLASFASMMSTRQHWFMPNEDPDADTHLLNMIDSEGPMSGILDTPGNNYAIDIRDLLWRGEQFQNYDWATQTTDFTVTKPAADGSRDYPVGTDPDRVFATAGGRIRLNGVLDCSIKTYPAVNPMQTQDDRQLANRD